MLPVPHLLLFLPICIFAGLFATAAAVDLIIRAAARPQPVQRAAAGRAAAGRAAARPSAQIIYMRPRQTALPSGFNAGLR